MNEPVISLCRNSRSIGIFDGFKLVKDFETYANELEALEAAKAFCRDKSNQEPQVVYPNIKSIRMTTAKRRKQ